jgi:hypothetical protein
MDNATAYRTLLRHWREVSNEATAARERAALALSEATEREALAARIHAELEGLMANIAATPRPG